MGAQLLLNIGHFRTIVEPRFNRKNLFALLGTDVAPLNDTPFGQPILYGSKSAFYMVKKASLHINFKTQKPHEIWRQILLWFKEDITFSLCMLRIEFTFLPIV